jgi:hypothetical protein
MAVNERPELIRRAHRRHHADPDPIVLRQTTIPQTIIPLRNIPQRITPQATTPQPIIPQPSFRKPRLRKSCANHVRAPALSSRIARHASVARWTHLQRETKRMERFEWEAATCHDQPS